MMNAEFEQLSPLPFISIIIPALNEAKAIKATIESVRCPFIEHEIIVVDAGSKDATAQIATDAGCQVLRSEVRQRAAQMNLGAAIAQGSVLLFLHADTRLGSGGLLSIRDALRDPQVVGGAFARLYDCPSPFLAMTCRLAALRNRLFGWHLGDQAMFVRCHVFQRCGPFSEVDQFEDLDFSRRLAGCGKTVTLQPPVVSAARRFAKDGPLLRTLMDVFLTCHYLVRGLGLPLSRRAMDDSPTFFPAKPAPSRSAKR